MANPLPMMTGRASIPYSNLAPMLQYAPSLYRDWRN